VLDENEVKLIENRFVSKRNVVTGILDEHFTYAKEMMKK
jgi:hypothetical protein